MSSLPRSKVSRLHSKGSTSAIPGLEVIWGFPKIRGTLLGGPHNKDHSILGSILGSLYSRKLPYVQIEEHVQSCNNR